jgi:hypothetical protein
MGTRIRIIEIETDDAQVMDQALAEIFTPRLAATSELQQLEAPEEDEDEPEEPASDEDLEDDLLAEAAPERTAKAVSPTKAETASRSSPAAGGGLKCENCGKGKNSRKHKEDCLGLTWSRKGRPSVLDVAMGTTNGQRRANGHVPESAPPPSSARSPVQAGPAERADVDGPVRVRRDEGIQDGRAGASTAPSCKRCGGQLVAEEDDVVCLQCGDRSMPGEIDSAQVVAEVEAEIRSGGKRRRGPSTMGLKL